MQAIAGIHLSCQHLRDHVTWKLDKKGYFSVKTAYWIARDYVLGDILSSSSHGDPFSLLWKTLWNAKVPGKVSICVWWPCHNLLPTREKLYTKGYTGDMDCFLCPHRLESVGHVLCDCPTTSAIFDGVPFFGQVQFTSSFNFKEWMVEQVTLLNSGNFAKLMMLLWNNVLKPALVLVSSCMAWYEDFLQASRIVQFSSVQNKQKAKVYMVCSS